MKRSEQSFRGFIQRFLDCVDTRPEGVAVRDLAAGIELTYGELRERAERTQLRLRQAGIDAGDVVGICLPTGLDFMCCYMACLSLGAVPLLLNPTYGFEDLAGPLRKSRPRLVVTLGAVATSLSPVLSELGVEVRLTDAQLSEEALLPDDFRESLPLREPPPAAVAAIFYTYKGLGRPLGVAHTYESVTRFVDVGPLAHWPRQTSSSVHMIVLPMCTVFGLGCGLVTPLSVGATALLPPKTRDFVGVLAEHDVQVFCFVPEIAKFLIAAAQQRSANGEDMPPLRPDLLLLSGASWLDPKIARKCGDMLGVRPIMQGYGATETFPCLSEHFEHTRRLGSMGVTMPGYRTRVVSHEGRDAMAGQIGELWVSGPSVAKGYLDDDEATAACFVGEWFRTGDLVRKDEEGFVFFEGRRARFAKISSYMVDLREIECALTSMEDVSAASVMAQRSAEGVDFLSAEVRAINGATITGPDLHRRLRARMAGFKVPGPEAVHVLTA